MPLSAWDAESLEEISFHWSEVYDIAVIDDTWTATPKDDAATVLTADSAYELRELLRTDYAGRQSSPAASRPELHERMST